MVVIALDSSFETCSVAVRGNAGRDHFVWAKPEAGRGADLLLQLVRDALADAGVAGRDLEAIVVTEGPGTFTGQRAAIAAAQGLKLASNATAFQVGSLAAMALSLEPVFKSAFEIIVDARRGGAYLQSFDQLARPTTPCRLVSIGAAAADLSAQTEGGPIDIATPNAAWLSELLNAEALPVRLYQLEDLAISAKALLDAPSKLGLAPVDKFRPHYYRKPDAAPAKKVQRAGP